MGRFRWPLLVFVLCLPVVVLAAGYELPWLRGPAPFARTPSVPAGDRDGAWPHTTPNAGTWERFVSGVQRATLLVPGMHADDSRAFPDRTTAVPEVAVTMDGKPGTLRIRWYKLSSYAKSGHWVQALADRDPSP